ncbi:hypothetical protein ABC304_07730 [Microbacterium sp. 1P10UB]|uniref:hypothetical protein n=1 Tax=unclassified Microbacterium TaxID=2609290 RepID=UPI0039A3446E
MTIHVDLAEEIEKTLSRLENHVRAAAGDYAVLHRQHLPSTAIDVVRVVPKNPRARRIEIIGEQFLVIQIGEHGGRWELGYETTDVEFAEQLIDAAIAGRVTETFGVGFSRVVVVLSDGSSDSDTAIGVLVSPIAWNTTRRRIRGPRVRYEPYDTPQRSTDCEPETSAR